VKGAVGDDDPKDGFRFFPERIVKPAGSEKGF
jgi:hypothetical protein